MSQRFLKLTHIDAIILVPQANTLTLAHFEVASEFFTIRPLVKTKAIVLSISEITLVAMALVWSVEY
jgi:hypothetical protein